MNWLPAARDRRHVSEDRLVALALDATAVEAPDDPRETDRHVERCAHCAARLQEMAAFVGGLSATVQADVEDRFSPEHLSVQRDRILRRLERLVGGHSSAKVLVFPGSGRPLTSAPFTVGRWLAVAAAAGVLIGVTLGQFIDLVPGALPDGTMLSDPPAAEPSVAARASDAADGMSSDDLDEVFLEQLELDLTLQRLRVSELRAFDELTPRVQEIALNVQ